MQRNVVSGDNDHGVPGASYRFYLRKFLFEEFAFTIRTGIDLDQLHPNCLDPDQGPNTICFSRKLPFDGNLSQVMPWPDLRHITKHQLRAIYEYLKAIPCVPGPADPKSPLHNDCGP